MVRFILYYQRRAEKITRRRCFVFQLLNDTLDLIKLGLLKQFFSNCFVLRAKKLTVAEVIQNVPSSKTLTARREFQLIQRFLCSKSTFQCDSRCSPTEFGLDIISLLSLLSRNIQMQIVLPTERQFLEFAKFSLLQSRSFRIALSSAQRSSPSRR